MTATGAQFDHLVVLADSLQAGEAWCQRTLGVASLPGGAHPLMGTHNRLLRLGADANECAYLEIIAIDPTATSQRPPGHARWFDMDQPDLRRQVALRGPQLIHWVARVPAMAAALDTLNALGLARGDAISASRNTPHGLLQWRISVRPDGQRLFDGALPTLIEWSGAHPAASMPASGVRLRRLQLRHPEQAALQAALNAIDLPGVEVLPGAAALSAVLDTPAGPVELSS